MESPGPATGGFLYLCDAIVSQGEMPQGVIPFAVNGGLFDPKLQGQPFQGALLRVDQQPVQDLLFLRRQYTHCAVSGLEPKGGLFQGIIQLLPLDEIV